MSLKRKMSRSKNRVEYVQTTDDNGDEILFIMKNGVVVEEIKLYPVSRNEHGEEVMTIKKDGVEQKILVEDFVADNGGKFKKLEITKHDSFIKI